MATLIKRSGSPYWIAAFDVAQPDGSVRRLKKSTKRKKRSEAITEAIRLEELECKASTSTGETASAAYAILAEAAKAAAKGELSEARTRELLARLCEVSTGQRLPFYTVRSWAADWLSVKATTSKPATLSRYSGSVNAFLAWLGDKADGKLEGITKADVRSFRDAIRNGWVSKKKNSNGMMKVVRRRTAKTANHFARDIAGMFRSAVREGLLLASPCAALEGLPEDDSIEREVFTIAEVGKLVETAGSTDWQSTVFSDRSIGTEIRTARLEDWPGMILVGFYAGARLGDCARLMWGNVNLAKKTLSFMPAKTARKRKRLEVPLHPRLLAWLDGRQAGEDEDPVFPALFKTGVSGVTGLSLQFGAIMDAAGVDRRKVGEGKSGGQRNQHARSFHALRHSLTSTLANADVSEEIRRRIVGHESAEVHSGYTHHERETLARAVEKIPSV